MPEVSTVVEALATLADEGYRAEFSVAGGGARCSRCQTTHAPADLVVERVFRFEGESDPDDEAIVVGLRCPHCGITGALVSAYGPAASEEEAEFLRALPLPPS